MFIKDKVLFNLVLHFENVIFGYLKYDNSVEDFVIKQLILLVKFHIHKCKFSKKKPKKKKKKKPLVFLVKLENYFSAIQSSDAKANKTVHFL